MASDWRHPVGAGNRGAQAIWPALRLRRGMHPSGATAGRLMAETECGASGQGRAFGASTALLRRHWWSKSNAWFPQRMTELSPICPKGVIEALPDSTSSEPQSDIRRASFDNTESRVAGR